MNGDPRFEQLTADEAAAEIARVERERRRLDAEAVALLDRIDWSGVFRTDGHFSARVMMRLHGHLSGSEAAQRDRVMKALRDLPAVAACYGDGLVGSDQVRRIAAVWANPRVREYLSVCEDEFLLAARELEYVDFDAFCVQWVNAVDMEGAHEKANRRWRRRRIQLSADFNGFWSLDGRLMSADGADLKEVLDRLVDALRLGDIEVAKAEHGDNWRQHLPRTLPQLRYDAFVELVRRGAMVGPDGEKLDITIDYCIDGDTYEQQAALLVGAEPPPLEPTDRHRFSRTADGTYVNPAEIVARSLVSNVRRVVFDAGGVVIDLGRRSRLFTGNARDAALLSELACYWTGCWVPSSSCQVDHLVPWEGLGKTNPGNGAPACGTHNRIKQQGFHAWRTPTGEWRISRPDGSPVPDHLTHWPDPSADTHRDAA
ncbi:MAG: DUF222 domain-containing protein [Acidimicrobiales bacterium]|nr:DUF222 domain-containing protein [Acidimicrobiales bacterium]